ncbi:hypothetical protein F5X97DRAFT_301579 [Nemania serpens]|nr:hypothetical protein F5X97DRAFT_301579 [Nemania serpens]
MNPTRSPARPYYSGWPAQLPEWQTFPGLFYVDEDVRLKMLTALRVLFCCVTPVYYFLVRYNEQGTELLSWAEWLE